MYVAVHNIAKFLIFISSTVVFSMESGISSLMEGHNLLNCNAPPKLLQSNATL